MNALKGMPSALHCILLGQRMIVSHLGKQKLQWVQMLTASFRSYGLLSSLLFTVSSVDDNYL